MFCLLEDGVLPGLADDEVGPLHHHDRHEEGGVAGVLQDLTVPINIKLINKNSKFYCIYRWEIFRVVGSVQNNGESTAHRLQALHCYSPVFYAIAIQYPS